MDQVEQRPMFRVDQPVYPRVRHRGTQCRCGWQGVHDVAERPESNDQDVHPRMRASTSRVE